MSAWLLIAIAFITACAPCGKVLDYRPMPTPAPAPASTPDPKLISCEAALDASRSEAESWRQRWIEYTCECD